MKTTSWIVLFITFVIISTGIIGWAVGVSNDEKSLRLKIEAQKQNCEAYFDKMWKVLQQKANIADQYKDAFKEVYVPLIEGRYSNDAGTFMKWIQEQNPQFDASLYKDLMIAVEGQREGFYMEQKMLIDMDREHKTMRTIFPKNIIIGKRPNVEYTVITSAKTKDTYKTGEENDMDLFN